MSTKEITDWLTIDQASRFEQIDKRSVLNRIQCHDYKDARQQKSTKGGKGGKEWRIHYSSLSADGILKYMDAIDTPKPDKRKTLAQKKQKIHQYHAADEWNKKKADAREIIIKAMFQYQKNLQLLISPAIDSFVILYNGRTAPNIEDWVYETEKTLSRSTLYRFKQKYEKYGIAGLLSGHGTSKNKYKSITPEMQVFILRHYSAKPHIRMSTLHKLMQKTFEKVPSKASVKRFLEKWKERNLHVSAMLGNPTVYKNNFHAAFGSYSITVPHFGHTWEMDSTPADVLCADGKRCAIIGSIDVFSDRVKVVTAPTSRATAIAACIRECLLDWGVPDVIRMDNGKDYKSRHVHAITTAMSIETPKLRPYSPDEKPFIERFFGTMTRGLEELLPGYIGHSVSDRKAIEEQKKWASKIMERNTSPVEIPLTMEELKMLIDKWIYLYEREKHSGDHMEGLSPIDKAKTSSVTPDPITDVHVLDILLMPVDRPKKVRKKGIKIDGAWYVAKELVPWIGYRVECRRDFSNAGVVYVFDALNEKKFICEAYNKILEGHDLQEYLKARAQHTKHIKETARALDTLNKNQPTALEIYLSDVPENIGVSETSDIEDNKDNVVQFADMAGLVEDCADPQDCNWMDDDELEEEYQYFSKQKIA